MNTNTPSNTPQQQADFAKETLTDASIATGIRQMVRNSITQPEYSPEQQKQHLVQAIAEGDLFIVRQLARSLQSGKALTNKDLIDQSYLGDISPATDVPSGGQGYLDDLFSDQSPEAIRQRELADIKDAFALVANEPGFQEAVQNGLSKLLMNSSADEALELKDAVANVDLKTAAQKAFLEAIRSGDSLAINTVMRNLRTLPKDAVATDFRTLPEFSAAVQAGYKKASPDMAQWYRQSFPDAIS